MVNEMMIADLADPLDKFIQVCSDLLVKTLAGEQLARENISELRPMQEEFGCAALRAKMTTITGIMGNLKRLHNPLL